MAIKKGDFIEVEYTGKLKEDGIVFDTTDEKIAKENNIYEKESSYGPVVICLGENHLIKGLDTRLEGKELGKEYTFEIPSEEGFGKKSAKLLRLVPISTFKKNNIIPQKGLQVNIDGMNGIIKTASGGRVIVDFNNPLSSRDLIYIIKVNKIVEEPKEKISALIKLTMGLKDKDFTLSKVENVFEVKLNKQLNLPEQVIEEIKKNIEKLTGEKVSFK